MSSVLLRQFFFQYNIGTEKKNRSRFRFQDCYDIGRPNDRRETEVDEREIKRDFVVVIGETMRRLDRLYVDGVLESWI